MKGALEQRGELRCLRRCSKVGKDRRGDGVGARKKAGGSHCGTSRGMHKERRAGCEAKFTNLLRQR